VRRQNCGRSFSRDTGWRTLLSINHTDQVIKALEQVGETEMVAPEIARDLGFLKSLDPAELAKIDVDDDKIAIPRYRHAMINFPHALLEQGLSVVDTPGLNALGIEPELTYQALESANAIVFVLSADTGVTKSELDAWNKYVKNSTADHILVVINKIDTLWDELKTQTEIDRQIQSQVSDVARILKVPVNRIFPVSAQKALVAHNNNDDELLKASGIRKYEESLADTVNYTSRKGVIERARIELTPPLNAIKRVLEQRLESTGIQISEINKFQDNQNKIADDNIAIVKKDRQKLSMVLEKINAVRVELKMDYEKFVDKLDIFALDKLIAEYRFAISNRLTPPGLQREMNLFQSHAVEQFKDALQTVTNLEFKITTLYQFVEDILDVKGLGPRKLYPQIYLKALRQHQEKHREYTDGLTLMMTGQEALRDRHYAAVTVKLHRLYTRTRDDIDLWCRSVLIPLELEVKEREVLLKKRLLSLERIRDKSANLQDELRVTQSRLNRHQQRYKTLVHFLNRLDALSEQNQPDLSNVISLHRPSAVA